MAAIGCPTVTLAAEVVGYSRLIRADEKGTLERLEAHRTQFVHPKIAEHCGRVVRAAGDNLLVEFESPTEAVRCAVELQSGMIERNIRTSPDRQITFRVGVTIGQVTGDRNDLVSRAVAALPRDTLATLIKPGAEVYSEPGNIAVHLAALAEPAGVCISGAIRDAIRDQLPYMFKDIGEQNLESRAAPVPCYAMNADAVASYPHLAAQQPQRRPMRLRGAAVAAGVFATIGVWGLALWAWGRHKFVHGTNPRPTDCEFVRTVCRYYSGRGRPSVVVAAISACEQHGGRHRYPSTAGAANPACQRHGGGQRYASTIGIATGRLQAMRPRTAVSKHCRRDLPHPKSVRSWSEVNQRRRRCKPQTTTARPPSEVPKRPRFFNLRRTVAPP